MKTSIADSPSARRALGSLLSCLVMLLSLPAQAFCIYNNSSSGVTVVRLPFNLYDSYKGTIAAGSSACCNWQHGGCTSTDGQFGKTYFAIFPDTVSVTELYEANLVNWVGVATEAAKAINDARKGGNFSNMLGSWSQMHYGMMQRGDGRVSVTDADNFLHDLEQAASLPLASSVRVYATTYNGGIIDLRDDHVWGCWLGSCLGQDINYDGTTGYPGNSQSCPSDRICDAGCCETGKVCDHSQNPRQCVPPPPPPPPPPECGGSTNTCTSDSTCVNGNCCVTKRLCGGRCCDFGACLNGSCRMVGGHMSLKTARMRIAGEVLEQENDRHARHVTQLFRIEDLATAAGDTETLSSAEALMAREIKRHQQWVSGDEPETGGNRPDAKVPPKTGR